MKTSKRIISILLAVLCTVSAFGVSAFAGTAYDSFGGKYGKVYSVKDDGKTKCNSFSVNGTSTKIKFYLDSKGYNSGVYFGISIYTDKEMQNVYMSKTQTLPAKDTTATLTVDFLNGYSGVYYGVCYTYIKKSGNYVIDKDTMYNFKITVNRVGSAIPKILEAEALYNCNYLKWESVPCAEYYRVYRRNSETESWVGIANTADCSYIDTTAVRGEKYYYTVRAFDGNYKSKYNTLGAETVYLAPASFTEAKYIEDNKVLLCWSEVYGAEGYRVYRKTADSNYRRIANIDGKVTEYIDDSEKIDGETYIYLVRAVNGTVLGLKSPEVQVFIDGVKKPVLSSDGTTVKISWDKVEYAESYNVLKQDENGGWSVLLRTTDEFFFIDEDVEVGKSYTYGLLVYSYGTFSSFDSVGETVRVLNEPVITSLGSSVDNTILIKWNSVEDATEYDIYRKPDGGEYELAGTTSKTSFYDSKAKENNLKYFYYVVAKNSNGQSVSGNNVKSCLYMDAPEISSVKSQSDGNKIVWHSVAGATSYKVYRKTPGGSFKAIATVQSNETSYVDKTAEKGAAYYYTVVPYNGSNKGSYYAGKGINCLDPVEITSLSSDSSGAVSVKWNKVANATGYTVYRRTADGAWKCLGKTTASSYKDTEKLISGETYFYTVKAYNSKGNGIYHSYSYSWISLDKPIADAIILEDGNVSVTWNTVKGASFYRVYRKTDTTGWSRIGEVTSENFIDETAENDIQYYYTVRAVNGNSLSGYDSSCGVVKVNVNKE
ncbi:MAG: hypothetical protein ACI4IF_01035 [Acutalibacteraceae bacterium]